MTTTKMMLTSANGRGIEAARLLLLWLLLASICWWLPGSEAQKPLLTGARKRDLYIAGLFPYATHVPESIVGRGVMPSVKLAIDHINDNPNVLRNYRLHMWWNDTQVGTLVLEL
uniref:Uncharacterized protein n=1 Tax=Trichogramma kaykai TaxID=54128 RepID=A0ABD2WDL4_9HYME